MDQRTESIRQEIDETRGSMTDKMEQIESQVYDTVDDVKESAYETVDRVKEKVNVQRMVDERPWTMFGASVLAGFVLGSITGSEGRGSDYDYDYEHSAHRRAYGRDQDYYERPRGAYRYLDETSYYTGNPTPAEMRRGHGESEGNSERAHHEYHPSYEREPSRERAQREYSGDRERHSGSGIRSTMQQQFGGEIEALRRAALSTATNSLRTMLQENLPQFAEEFDRARHEQEQRYQAGATPQHSHRPSEESNGGRRERRGQSDMDFTTTQQSSDTPSSIVAPAETGKEGTSFETTHQDMKTSTSINAPEVEKQR
jgi:ElaB/YqjD/DUF883 family membrane-anchored ribosome-binding protein